MIPLRKKKKTASALSHDKQKGSWSRGDEKNGVRPRSDVLALGGRPEQAPRRQGTGWDDRLTEGLRSSCERGWGGEWKFERKDGEGCVVMESYMCIYVYEWMHVCVFTVDIDRQVDRKKDRDNNRDWQIIRVKEIEWDWVKEIERMRVNETEKEQTWVEKEKIRFNETKVVWTR